jgi:peptidyl-prolyl cis-trans isomerase B (cyclophilin B)
VRSTAAAAFADRFAWALADSGARRTIADSLAAHLGDPDVATRMEAARSLMVIQRRASPAVRRLMVDDLSIYVRNGVIDGLRRLPPVPRWAGVLEQRLSPETPLLERMTAADVIGARAEPGSAGILRAALGDTSVLFTAACASALGAMNDSSSAPLLVDAWRQHAHDLAPDACDAIHDALRDIEGAAYADSIARAHPRRAPAPVHYAPGFEDPPRAKGAVLHTERGDIEWSFYDREAPQTVRNFVDLARRGYFDGRMFHRVVPNFVIQDGDPTGTGSGGPGYTIRCEYNRLHYGPGMVGMALSGKDTGGSQWFITHSPQPHLDGRYTIFARVVKGMDVVQEITQGDHVYRVEILE